jgi:membrane protease subunit HflC
MAFNQFNRENLPPMWKKYLTNYTYILGGIIVIILLWSTFYQIRPEGAGEASKINGEKERDLKTIQSEAYRKAEEIRGQADARATAVYAGAYDQSASSRNLYGFVKSMETFEKTFDTTTTIIISTKSELYKYLIDLQ